MRTLFFAILLLTPWAALAEWQLENEHSSLTFITVKKEQVAEVNHFKKLRGSVSDEGKVLLEVSLLSVESNILLRNERMQEFLFETRLFPAARFITELPAELISSIAKGTSKQYQLKGIINLHGVIKDVEVPVLISRLEENRLVVASISPLLIMAGDFNLEAGVSKLQQLAELPGITRAVPVSFVLSFNK
jgi:polyisoprenoid-binding protein YceI